MARQPFEPWDEKFIALCHELLDEDPLYPYEHLWKQGLSPEAAFTAYVAENPDYAEKLAGGAEDDGDEGNDEDDALGEAPAPGDSADDAEFLARARQLMAGQRPTPPAAKGRAPGAPPANRPTAAGGRSARPLPPIPLPVSTRVPAAPVPTSASRPPGASAAGASAATVSAADREAAAREKLRAAEAQSKYCPECGRNLNSKGACKCGYRRSKPAGGGRSSFP